MDKKFKVLQFPIANAKGGVTQYALNNWQYINKDKFQFDFATLSKKLDFADDLAAQGCKIHYISCYAEENKSQFVTEVDKALSEGYDAVHIHTSYWKSFLVEELAVKHKIPKIIVHSHSTMVDILDDNKRASAVELHERQKKNFSADLATHFCACSQAAADWLFGEQIPKDKIKILNNAINVDDFSYNPIIRKEYRRKLGVDNCFVLGNIGRFVYQKNHDFLIDVFNEAAAAIPNAKLLLVGAGELEDSIRRKVELLNLQDKVVFLGKRSDVNCLMQAMDVFLLPSRFEGLPIVLIEAQATGLNCITSTNVTREAAVTDNIRFVELNKRLWAEQIVKFSKTNDRKNVDEIITEKGFNIKYEITKLEKLYSL